MYEYECFEMNNMQTHFSLPLLTLNVPFQTGKSILRGTCTPGCEPLV